MEKIIKILLFMIGTFVNAQLLDMADFNQKLSLSEKSSFVVITKNDITTEQKAKTKEI